MNKGKYRYRILFFLLLGVCSCTDKTEENDGWEVCLNCDLESWLGLYNGTASHFTVSSNKTIGDLSIEIEIEETASDYLTVYLKLPQQSYYATLSGDFVQPYAISFASSTKSINATMFVRDNQLRLSGSSKKYESVADSIVIKEVVNFDVYK